MHRSPRFPKNILLPSTEVNLFRIMAYSQILNPLILSFFLIRLVHWDNGNKDFQNYVSEKNGAGCQDLGLRQIFQDIL